MSRKPNIKWRESDAEKLNKEIERFNAKIYRTRYNHPELKGILPDTIKKDDKEKLIQELKNAPRSEFKKELKSLERFQKRGAEKPVTAKQTGNTVTNWEKKEISLKVAQINRERTKERKKVEQMEATSRGEPIGLKRGEMGSERLNALQPKKFNFDKIKGGKEWEKFKAGVLKQASPVYQNEKFEEYKKNYIKALETTLGGYADDIIVIIKQLPAETVVETYYREQEATINFTYDPQDAEIKADILNDIWQGVYDDYIENEIDG